MQEYQLSPAFFSRLKRRLIAAQLVFGAAFAGFLLLIAPWKFVLPVALLSLGWHLWRIPGRLKTMELSFSSLRIAIDTQGIDCVQDGLPEVHLRWEEVVRVIETEGSGLTVFGSRPLAKIGIPVTLDHYAEARARIAMVKEIERRRSFTGYLLWAGRILLLGLFVAAVAGVFAPVHPWLKLACCLAVAAVFIKYLRQPKVEQTLVPEANMTRWLLPLMLAIVLISAAVAISQLLGYP